MIASLQKISRSEEKIMIQHNITRAPRTDFRTRDVVNQAIAAIPQLGLQQVAEYLNAMNVPPEIAIRTLVYPERRRNY
jgi:hypothetical protein